MGAVPRRAHSRPRRTRRERCDSANAPTRRQAQHAHAAAGRTALGEEDRLRILITGAGGPSAISFIRAVEGPGIELFAADIDPYAAGLYLVPPERRWIVFRGRDPRFVDDVLARCVAANVDVIVPAVDFELLAFATRRHEFEACGISLLLASAASIEICVDKWKLTSTCRDVCPVPQTAVLDASFASNPWPLPFLVKPRHGSGGTGQRRVLDARTLADCPHDGSLIAQEILPGREYSVDVLSNRNAEPLAIVPRSRLKIDSGIAVTGRTLHDERLASFADAVARRLGLTFVSNIQFREDATGTPKLMDVNARFPGTMPLTVAAGVNMPRLALSLLRGETIDRASFSFRDVAVTRTWQEHFIDVDDMAALEAAARERDAR